MDDNSFVIDTSPTIEPVSSVPQYRVARKSLELLQLEKDSLPKFRKQQYNNLNCCWNCGTKNHSLRDCTLEKTPITIEWNRGLHTMGKQYEAKKFQKKSGRYHQTDKVSEDFPHVRPGVISSKLRQVLGLSDHELPPYTYRLRAHGYPNAWLKHAMVKPSGMNLYDAHGNEVADPDAEDGEILEEEDKVKYDLSKLIQIPGFNSPMPENSVDEYNKMNSSPFNEEQSLENMIKNLKEKAVTEYCLRKNKSSSSAAFNLSQESNDDMDVDHSVSSLEEKSTVENRFIAPVPNDEIRIPTPLDDTISCSSQTDSDSLNLSQDSKLSQSSEVSKTTSVSLSQNGLGRILSSAEGTPLLKSKSGHARLPPAENFSKNICDVINFENLPESTGKFEKMRNLLKKVKKILGIQKQNS